MKHIQGLLIERAERAAQRIIFLQNRITYLCVLPPPWFSLLLRGHSGVIYLPPRHACTALCMRDSHRRALQRRRITRKRRRAAASTDMPQSRGDSDATTSGQGATTMHSNLQNRVPSTETEAGTPRQHRQRHGLSRAIGSVTYSIRTMTGSISDVRLGRLVLSTFPRLPLFIFATRYLCFFRLLSMHDTSQRFA